MNAEFFPAIKPSSRSFDIGSYPEAVFEAQNGAKSYIRYGNKRVNASLTLGFTNISDENASKILKHYMDTNKDSNKFVRFSMADGMAGIEGPGATGGADYSLHDWVEGEPIKAEEDVTDGMRWRYNGSPKVSSVQPGISNVTCSFVGCLHAD
tara:strand:- start:906 stop:1361 length:456 start_codon:yes stop_codon:yes gene_type:complete